MSPRGQWGGPQARGAPSPLRHRRTPRAAREMLRPGAAAGPILLEEQGQRDQSSTGSAPPAHPAPPRKALEPAQSFQGTSGRSRTNTETPRGPSSVPRGASSAVRVPTTLSPPHCPHDTVPTLAATEPPGGLRAAAHLGCCGPLADPAPAPHSPRPLLPSLTCSRFSRSCRRVSALSRWSSACSRCRTRSLCCRRERLPRCSSRSLCRRSGFSPPRAAQGHPRLQEGSSQGRVPAGCPGPSPAQGGH